MPDAGRGRRSIARGQSAVVACHAGDAALPSPHGGWGLLIRDGSADPWRCRHSRWSCYCSVAARHSEARQPSASASAPRESRRTRTAGATGSRSQSARFVVFSSQADNLVQTTTTTPRTSSCATAPLERPRASTSAPPTRKRTVQRRAADLRERPLTRRQLSIRRLRARPVRLTRRTN